MLRFVFQKVGTSVVLGVLAFVTGHALSAATHQDVRDFPSPPAVASDSAPTPARLLEAHHCWTHQAPHAMQGKVPGHVVVTTRSGKTRYGGAHLVGRALDQEFAHKRAGLTVWAFCR